MPNDFRTSRNISGRLTQPEYLLQPVNPLFIWFSLIMALLFNFMPWGRAWYVPDMVAVCLVFWNIHQPRRVGIGAAFAFGLLMDVHSASLLGEHALAYTLLSYFAITIHRRVVWFNVGGQAIHVLPLLLASQLVVMAVRWMIGGGATPNLLLLTQSVIGAALWPLVTWLLLAPQRRAVDKDHNRPI